MRAVARHLAALAAVVLALPASASGQDQRIFRPPEGGTAGADIILYREADYKGQFVRVQTPVPNLGINWPIRSARVLRGEWQLCRGASYGGRCIDVRDDLPATESSSGLGMIRSARPVKVVKPPSEGEWGPSLRGMASAFFTAPASDGNRILACRFGSATPDCARTTAERFCRARGYGHVGNVAMQTVSGRVYLADVLCRRSAG